MCFAVIYSAVCLSTQLPAEAAASPLVVYDDALNTAWQDWSWDTTTNYSDTFSAHSGTKAIKATFQAGWAGLQIGFHGAQMDISAYDTFVFWAHGGSAGGQNIRFTLSSNGSNASVSQDFTLAANTWTKVEVALASMGSPRQAYSLQWQSFSANIQPAIYLDDLSFVSLNLPPPTPGVGPDLIVDAALDQKPINPDIYGMNFMGINAAELAFMDEIHLPVNRWGGNATTRYNWKINASNHAMDWYFENLPQDLSADAFIAANKLHGANTLLTLPMIGFVAKDADSCGFSISKYGPQQDADIWRPNCGNGKQADGSFLTGNDPVDTGLPITTTFITQWIQHLRLNFGVSGQGGVQYFNLDNEPMLWNSTHRDVHPQPLSYDELIARTFNYAAAVKVVEPGAKILGPAEWGWVGYFYSALDQAGGGDWWNHPADRLAHGDFPLVEWYLQQLRSYENTHGVRLLDYLDEHYYPQSTGVSLSPAGDVSTQALRLRSTRSLWDPTYTDESWINEPVYLLPRMRQWVNANYSGTRLAVGEYNWGALDHINGALAQADVLGIFGREGLDLATLWAPPKPNEPGAFAFRMYRNYDGQHSEFGNISVRAASPDQDKLSVFAALRTSDGSLTVMVINKSFQVLTSSLTVDHFGPTTGAWGYRYSTANLSAIQAMGYQVTAGGTLKAIYPENSITLWVFSKTRPPLTPRAFLPMVGR